MYNPLIHKKPYGATAVDKETTIIFPLEKSVGIKRMFVVLRKDKESIRYEMPLDHSTQTEDFFVCKFA